MLESETEIDNALLEAVARALCIESGKNPDALEPGNVPTDYEDGSGNPFFYLWRRYEDSAIAAIEAYRKHFQQSLSTSIKIVPSTPTF